MWGWSIPSFILFPFVLYADRNEEMFQLIFLAFYGFHLHKRKKSDRNMTQLRNDKIINTNKKLLTLSNQVHLISKIPSILSLHSTSYSLFFSVFLSFVSKILVNHTIFYLKNTSVGKNPSKWLNNNVQLYMPIHWFIFYFSTTNTNAHARTLTQACGTDLHGFSCIAIVLGQKSNISLICF